MTKKIFVLAGIIGAFSLGSAGGLWAQAFLLPYASSHPVFQEWQIIKDWGGRTIIVREIQEVVITKEEAVAKVVRQGEAMAVGIESSNGALARSGSGLVVTSDGLIITLADIVPEGYTPKVYMKGQKNGFFATVLKRDSNVNLAVLKIEARDLPIASFAGAVSWEAGDTVVMIARVKEAGKSIQIVQEGTVRTVDTGNIRTNIFDKPTLGGSPLFNMKGQVIGLTTFEKDGRLIAIPVSFLREFLGF